MPEVTTRSDLLTWFAKQLRNAEPKGNVAVGVFQVFDDVIDHCLDENGSLDIVHHEWVYYFLDVFALINKFPGQQRCSALVPEFLAVVYGEANATGVVSGQRLIKVMMELLELSDADLKTVRTGGRKCLVSTDRFERQHGVSVRIQLGGK